MLGTGQDLRIIIRDIEFLFIACKLLGAQLRLTVLYCLQPLITDDDRHKIRIREVTVIMRILLGTHRIGIFLVVIPAARLLNDLLALLDQLDLTGTLPFDRTGDCLEGVQVLHLGSRTELLLRQPHAQRG